MVMKCLVLWICLSLGVIVAENTQNLDDSIVNNLPTERRSEQDVDPNESLDFVMTEDAMAKLRFASNGGNLVGKKPKEKENRRSGLEIDLEDAIDNELDSSYLYSQTEQITFQAISSDVLLYPENVPSLKSLTCYNEGDMYRLNWVKCHTCTCVYGRNRNLILKCATCDCTTSETAEPALTAPTRRPSITPAWMVTTRPPKWSYPTEPSKTITTTNPPPSCSPFPTNKHFPNPLNPCQTCICRSIFKQNGLTDIQITCESNDVCVVPTTTAPPQPVSESSTPYPITVIAPTDPSNPLPGPTPHTSCKPFPPSQYFTHPHDDCKICICQEHQKGEATEVEVTCLTKPECCVEVAEVRDVTEVVTPVCVGQQLDRPFTLPDFPCQVFQCSRQYSAVFAQISTIPDCHNPVLRSDEQCQNQPLNTDFLSKSDHCKICRCEMYGNYVVPVCKKADRHECETHPIQTEVSEVQITFIVGTCKYRAPHEEFITGCMVCQCKAVFSFVTSYCIPRINCVPDKKGSLSMISEAGQNMETIGKLYIPGNVIAPISESEEDLEDVSSVKKHQSVKIKSGRPTEGE